MNHMQTILHRVVFAALASVAALAPSFITPAYSATPLPVAMTAADTPLVVIRFNQRRVYYEQPLYTAVSRAMEIKPDVRFHLIGFVPATGDSSKDEKLLKLSNQHLSEVSRTLMGMGIAQPQISTSTELASGIQFDEVHIFVQ